MARVASKGGTKPATWERARYSRAKKVELFLESLPVTKGILQGKKMKLLPEQREFIQAVYGPKKTPRLVILSEPRGNGKTGLIAGLMLCHLLGPEAEVRGECYSAAIDRQQAGIIFNEMEAIIMAVDDFGRRVNVQRFHKKIEVMDGRGNGSVYEALSADARRAHGLSPSFWAYDELAQAKDRELLDNLMTAMGKRKRSLGMVISTQAPSDDHPLSQLIDDALRQTDPSILAQIISAPADADPFDPKVIESVNPAFGKFLSREVVLEEADLAQRMPTFEPRFRNLRLNQRVAANSEGRLCSARVWEPLGVEPVNRTKLNGRTCFAALDLSAKEDLTALTLAFPDDSKEPTYDLLQFFWTPHGQIENRRPAERDRFREWIRSGHMLTTPGPSIRYAFVARELIALSNEFNIQVLGYDAWRFKEFRADLLSEDPNFDVPLEPFKQDYKTMGGAIKWFIEVANTGRLRHGNHPVLNACVANAVLSFDQNENPLINKDLSRGKGPVRVDGAVTMVMALQLAKNYTAAEKPAFQFMVL